MKNKQESDVEEKISNLKIDDLSDVSYQFFAEDEASQPGYFVTKSGHDFTQKELLAADEFMKDIKN
jgi:hypothetical protein